MSFATFKHTVFFIYALVNIVHGDNPIPNAPKLNCLSLGPSNKTMPAGLVAALQLQQNYKVVVRYTDQIGKISAKITESNFTDILLIQKEQPELVETFLFQKDTNFYSKNGECSAVKATVAQSIYNISDYLRGLLKNDALNLQQLLSGLGLLAYENQNVKLTPVWVDGIQTILWIGCVKQTDKTPAVEINIKYSEAKSINSYSDYKNPKVASVRMIVYQSDDVKTNQNIKYLENHSLTLVELEHTKLEEKLHVARIPQGTYCSNTTTAVKLPSTLPSRFEANIEYADMEKKVTDEVYLMYDEVNHVVLFALDFDNDLDIPYVRNSAVMTGRLQVLQDFNSGFEYILSRSGHVCKQVAPIQKTWNNVKELEGKLVLRDPTAVFFNFTQQPAYYAGQVLEQDTVYDLYVSRTQANSTSNYTVVEMLFSVANRSLAVKDAKQTIHSIVQYHKNPKHELLKKTSIRFNSIRNNTATGTSWSAHSVEACFPELQTNNFFYLKLGDTSIKSIQSYGYKNVENALIETLARIANISVLRVSNLLFTTVDNELVASFLLSERSNSTPAQTKYLVNERTVRQVQEILNSTLQIQKLVVSVITDDCKQVQVGVTSVGLMSTKRPAQPPASFVGYSSGSMFILAIFMFMFGAAGAVGAYVIYMKRQAVRGIAYQVFE